MASYLGHLRSLGALELRKHVHASLVLLSFYVFLGCVLFFMRAEKDISTYYGTLHPPRFDSRKRQSLPKCLPVRDQRPEAVFRALTQGVWRWMATFCRLNRA